MDYILRRWYCDEMADWCFGLVGCGLFFWLDIREVSEGGESRRRRMVDDNEHHSDCEWDEDGGVCTCEYLWEGEEAQADDSLMELRRENVDRRKIES